VKIPGFKVNPLIEAEPIQNGRGSQGKGKPKPSNRRPRSNNSRGSSQRRSK